MQRNVVTGLARLDYKPATLQGNRDIRKRPFTFVIAMLYPNLWKKHVRACLRENRTRS